MTNRVLTLHPAAQPPGKAFEELLGANLDALYRTAVRLCDGRTADAEDLLQEAMLRAFERRDDLREPRAGRSWLFTILVRTNLNRTRGRRRRLESFESDMSPGAFESALADWSASDPADGWIEQLDLRERVRDALDALGPKLRVVLVLTDVEGMTQREAAEILEIPEGTVTSRLFRARRELRAALAVSPDITSRSAV